MTGEEAVIWVGSFALSSLAAEFAAEPETFPVFRAWLAARFPGQDHELITIDKLRQTTVMMHELISQLPMPLV
ncbi:MAG TPA: hypothetical protein VNV62_00480 [Trebonia sp.]|jgi:hypothetical protein|nr:hypothetical protein [Trebonia sp.]